MRPGRAGGAVTVALCGSWDHDGPCHWPHHNDIDDTAAPARFRTLFVAPAQDGDEVTDRIRAVLDPGRDRMAGRVGPPARPDRRGAGAGEPARCRTGRLTWPPTRRGPHARDSPTSLDADLCVAGAGPVGMCVAIEAARRGLDVVVVEPRAAGEPPSAKCNTVAARTMETFRRFGIADGSAASGLPDDYPTDVIYTTSVAGPGDRPHPPAVARPSDTSTATSTATGRRPNPWCASARSTSSRSCSSAMALARPNVTVLNGVTRRAATSRPATG